MKIKDIKKEDLELMSYDDLADLILKEAGTKMKINNLFKEVCDLLSLGDDVFENKIADFFELLSTEKRFIMLENGFWDLRDNHSKKVIIDDDDDDSYIEDDVEVEENDKKEDIFEETDETDDIVEDDLKDFAVIDEDDEENVN